MKIDKKKIEIECMKSTLRDTMPILNSMGILVKDEDYESYIKKVQDDDRNNHLILAIRKAIDMTEKQAKQDIIKEFKERSFKVGNENGIITHRLILMKDWKELLKKHEVE